MKPKLILLTVLLTALSAFPAEYFVDASRPNDTGSATNWATAKQTIQAAVDLTVDGDTVWVTNGTYALSAEIFVTNAITVQSVNGSVETTVYGNSSNSCFVLNNACLISGLTIRNGKAAVGGGVHCSSDAPVVSNCVIAANSADYGGAMSFGRAFNCEVVSNSATSDGGGLYYTDVYNSLIYSNYSDMYAAAVSHGDVVNCTVTENFCGNKGQLMSQNGITLSGCRVKNSIVYYNHDSYQEISGSTMYYSCFAEASLGSDGNIHNAPDFYSTYRISTNSPCRSTGNADYVSGVDMEGKAWLTPPSMGCYEVYAPIFMTLVGPTNICVGAEGSYYVTVTGAVEELTVSLGDGQVITNSFQFEKGWDSAGSYNVVICGENAGYPQGVFFTQTVYVVNDSLVYVSEETGDDAADGTNWTSAKASIQAGVDTAAFGGTVLVSNGIYAVSQAVRVSNAIKVIAGSDPTQTIVDAGKKDRVFTLIGAGSTISGMTIRNGRVYISYPANTTYGGGIFCDGGNHIITNCIIVWNSAGYGGGGICGGTVYDSVISNNTVTSQNGGGIYGSKAYRCIIQNNVCGMGFGGGVYRGYVENCLILGNHGDYGGGISEGVAVGCAVLNNTAQIAGGVDSSAVKNSIICKNTSTFFGPNNYQYQVSAVYNSCSPDASHGVNGNITNAPLFIDESNDFRLQSNSPCINAGNNDTVSIANDLDDNPRIVGGVVDMGAYENQNAGADFDADGIADSWEMDHLGSRYSSASDTICSNGVNTVRDAYIAGLDPNDPNSEFLTSGFCPLTSGNVLQWQGVSGRVYAIYYSTNLLNGFQPLATNIPWTAGCFTDTVYNAEGQMYYKLDVRFENSGSGGGGGEYPFPFPGGGGDDDTPATGI